MEELSKKERREIKREEREREFSVQRRNAQFKKISKWVLGFAVMAGAGYGVFYFFSRIQGEGSTDLSQAIEIMGRTHVSQGSAVTDYNSNPPTSGPHWPDPVSRGVHEEEVPDEALVHNLEHGEVWISYRPGIGAEAKKELEDITRSFSKVVLTPRSKNDADIALAAWGRLDKFNLDGNLLDKERVGDFIKRYRNKGPELVP